MNLNTQILSLFMLCFIFYYQKKSSQKSWKMFCYFLQKALFAFEIFCCFLFFPFLSTVSRFKRSDQERNFCQYVLQLKKRLVTSSRHFLISMILSVYRDWVQRKKIKSTFSWSVVYIGCFGIFTNIKKGYETRF